MKARTLYFFKGAFRTDKDILDPKTQSGAYVPIAKQIHDDAQRLEDNMAIGRPMRASSTI